MLLVRNAMNPELFHLRPSDSVEDALRGLLAFGITGAPVLDGGSRPVGMLSLRELAQRRTGQTVSEIMATPALTIGHEATVAEGRGPWPRPGTTGWWSWTKTVAPSATFPPSICSGPCSGSRRPTPQPFPTSTPRPASPGATPPPSRPRRSKPRRMGPGSSPCFGRTLRAVSTWCGRRSRTTSTLGLPTCSRRPRPTDPCWRPGWRTAASGFGPPEWTMRLGRARPCTAFMPTPEGRRPARPSLTEAHGAFTTAQPAYERTVAIDELRAREFARLDALHHVYLDYTGSGLYAASQVAAAFRAAARTRVRQPPLVEPDLRPEHAARGALPAAASSTSSAPTPTSTRWCSRPTPATR